MSGFRRIGDGARIYPLAKILEPERIEIGRHAVVDDFVFIGRHDWLVLGNHVHVASHVSITGAGKCFIADFAGIATGARLLTGTDDFTAGALSGPTVPDDLRSVHRGFLVVGAHAIVGANAVVLPDVRIGEGATVGACAVVRHDLEPWTIYAGVPARPIGTRDRDAVLEAEEELHRRFGRPDPEYRIAPL